MTFSAARPGDAGAILTLQRAAYVSEAQIYGDPMLPPLVQTLHELREELDVVIALTAWLDDRLVGAVQLRVRDTTGDIGRLIVAPDVQGQGIGTALMDRIEAAAPPAVDRFALFTGDQSAANLRLYAKRGYQETERRRLSATVTLVHMAKRRG